MTLEGAWHSLCACVGVIPPPAPSIEALWQLKDEIEALVGDVDVDARMIAEALLALGTVCPDAQLSGVAFWTAANVFTLRDLPRDALRAYDQADLRLSTLADSLWRARMSVGYVVALERMGEGERALVLGREMLEVLEHSPHPMDRHRVAGMNNAIGLVYDARGWLLEARACYERKLAIWEADLPAPQAVWQCARSQLNLGMVALDLGQLDGAWQHLSKARDAFATLRPARPGVLSDLFRAELNLVLVAIQRGGAVDVIEREFARVRDLLATVRDASDFIFHELVELDWQMRQHGRLDQDRLGQVAQAAVQAGQSANHDLARILQARDLAAQQHTEAARQLLDVVERLSVSRADPARAFQAALEHGRLFDAVAQHAQHRAAFVRAIGYSEQVRNRLERDDLRAGFVETRDVAYRALVGSLLRIGDTHAALAVAEANKARTLQELRDGQVQPFELARAAQALSARIARMPGDSTIVSYVETEDELYAVVLDANGVVAPAIRLGERVAIDALRAQLTRLTAPRSMPAAIRAASARQLIPAGVQICQRLYDLVWAPLAPFLKDRHRLCISPAGALSLIPFPALHDRSCHLIERHTLELRGNLLMERPSSGPPSGAALVIGAGDHGLIPRALQEARDVARQLEASGQRVTLLLEAADQHRQVCAALRAGEWDLVYVAAHARARVDAPERSFIQLHDAALSAAEMLALRPRARRVMLSACSTLSGRLTGNEVFSLARGFLATGAQEVLSTLWPVDDDAMAVLMAHMTAAHQPGPLLGDALAGAQRWMLRQTDTEVWRHPFFWAAPAVIGS